jgi:gliding motility-associated protein GldL
MSGKKKGGLLQSRGWKKGVAMLYGIGAAVVIIGALFKILHFPGANEMLIVGLGTEAVIFFVSAFEPLPEEEVHWSWHKVFPQLKDDIEEDEIDIDMAEDGSELPAVGMGGGANVLGLGANLNNMDKLLADSKLSPQLFESLAESINGLKVNVVNLAEISDATVATNEYNDKIREAAGKIDQLTKGYASSVDSINQFGSSLNDVKAYQQQVQAVTQNLQSLNAVYTLELEDAQKHLNSINKFYGGISSVMQNLVDTSKETETLRNEVVSLSKNMQNLNAIYGGMLNAMASAGR